MERQKKILMVWRNLVILITSLIRIQIGIRKYFKNKIMSEHTIWVVGADNVNYNFLVLSWIT